MPIASTVGSRRRADGTRQEVRHGEGAQDYLHGRAAAHRASGEAATRPSDDESQNAEEESEDDEGAEETDWIYHHELRSPARRTRNGIESSVNTMERMVWTRSVNMSGKRRAAVATHCGDGLRGGYQSLP